jgi:hypothetical protein
LSFLSLKTGWAEATDGWRGESMKYLLIGPDIVARIRERHVVDIKSPINWVDSPEKATADYEAAAKVTQRRLTEFGMKTRVRDGSSAERIETRTDLAPAASHQEIADQTYAVAEPGVNTLKCPKHHHWLYRRENIEAKPGVRWGCGVEGCNYGYDANTKRRLGQDLGPAPSGI